MFRWIIGSSLKFRFLVVAAAAALVTFGSMQMQKMPVDVFPEFAPPKIEIQTESPGMTAGETEELITIPMDMQMRGVPNVEYVRSSSQVGLSQVVLWFKRGTDLMQARQQTQERLKRAIADLPQSSGMPVMLQPLSSTSRVMKIGITSKTMDMMDLSMTTYWKIKFKLMTVPGVANIPIWGDHIKALQVHVDPHKLRAHDVTMDDIVETVGSGLDFGLLRWKSNAKTRIDGMIDTPQQRLGIRHELPVFEPEDVAKMPLDLKKTRRTSPPRISDVASVVWGTWPMVGDGVVNNDIGLLMIVEKLPWANTLDVTRGIEKAIAEMKPGLPGVEIDTTIMRPASYIEWSIDNLTHAMIFGSILVVFVLGAFLFEWRVALISVIAIPVSLVAAGLVLYFMNATINTMILAGFVVALGSLVDDAVIDVENIVRRLREERLQGGTRSTASVILEASLEIRPSIMYATLIIMLSVAPVFFMGGLSGAFFEPLATAYVLAMLASMVVALTLTPALAMILLDRAGIERRESPLVPWLRRIYQGLLSKVIRAPRTTYASTIAVVVVGVAAWPLLGHTLLPAFKERDFLMHWIPWPGTSHPETVRITKASCIELIAIPGVRNCGSHIGRAVGGDEPYGVEFTENWISIDPKADYDKSRLAVETAVDGYPGLYRDVQTYLQERIKEVLTGAGDTIVVRIFGPELQGLRDSAQAVYDAMKDIDGIKDLHIERNRDVPQIQIKVDLEKAARYGLKPGDVRRTAAVLTSGIEVTDIHRDLKVYDVWVWAKPEDRRNADNIKELLIDTPYGGRVRLGEVADVTYTPVPNGIKRENASRRIDVHANITGKRDLGSIVDDVQDKLETVKFPTGYHPHLLGEWKERQAAQEGMQNYVILVAIAIFLLLVVSFGNWKLGLLIFMALPAALVGGILASFLGDKVISLGSLVGFLTVLGIAARNGILLIHHYQHLEQHEGMPFGVDLILRGARERLSPILMTSACTGLALLPLAITGNAPGHEVEYPMAIVILGGLITSTLLTLFLVPVLYLKFGSQGTTAAPTANPSRAAA